MRKKASALTMTVDGRQYHLHCKKGDVAPYVLIPGDPERPLKIAEGWDSSKEIAFHREYRTVTGKIGGVPISSTSSGVGAPALSIAVDELLRIGAQTFIRVGTCGSLQKDMHLGDLVISTGAVRFEGASKDFVIPEYPAVANYEVVMALVEAAEKLKVKYHVGITASIDTFYCGQGRPAFAGYLPSHKAKIFEDMQKAGVLNFEMEAACLFTMANIFGVRAGAICVVIADRVRDKFKISPAFEKKVGKVASEAVRILAGWDKEKKRKRKKFWFPSLPERR